jgi:hypothetical protein
MALTMAWFRTERYHRVLSYSGTFVNLRSSPEAPHAAYEYPENFFPKSPVKRIRIWMHVSDGDLGAQTDSAGMRNWPIANQRLAAVLKSKGYHYQFVTARTRSRGRQGDQGPCRPSNTFGRATPRQESRRSLHW